MSNRILLIVLLSVLPIGMPVLGAESAAEVSEPDIFQIPEPEQLEAKIAELSDLSDPAGLVARELELYKSALAQLKASLRDDAAVARLQQSIDQAAERKAELDAALEEVVAASRAPPLIPGDLKLAQLEQRLDQTQADKKIAENRLAELQARVSNERQRPDQITEGLQNIKLKLLEIEKKLETAKIPDGTDSQAEAEWVALMIGQRAMRHRLERLEMERLSSGPRMEHMRIQMQIRREELKQSELLVLSLQEAITRLRSEEAEQAQAQAKRAEREAAGKHPLILAAAEENARLSAQLGTLAGRFERAVSEKERTSRELQRVRVSLDNARQQLDVIRLDETIGSLLRAQRQGLPDINRLESESAQAQEVMADARLEQFRVDEERRKLLEQQASRDGPVDGGDKQTGIGLKRELEVLSRDRLNLLEQLHATYLRFDKTLNDLEVDRTQLMVKSLEYAELLDRSLIWIPSAKSLDLDVLGEAVPELLTVLRGGNWKRVFESVGSVAAMRPLVVSLLILAIVFLLLLRTRMRDALEIMEHYVGDVALDSFYLTYKALIITILLSIPWVVLLAALGWLLKSEPHPVGDALSPILLKSAVLISMIQFARYLFIPYGLAEVHFRWNRAANTLFRRHLRWFLVFTAVILFFWISAVIGGGPGLPGQPGQNTFHDLVPGSVAVGTSVPESLVGRRGTAQGGAKARPVLALPCLSGCHRADVVPDGPAVRRLRLHGGPAPVDDQPVDLQCVAGIDPLFPGQTLDAGGGAPFAAGACPGEKAGDPGGKGGQGGSGCRRGERSGISGDGGDGHLGDRGADPATPDCSGDPDHGRCPGADLVGPDAGDHPPGRHRALGASGRLGGQ